MEYNPKQQRFNDMIEAVKDINLSEKEIKFLNWLSNWDPDTVYSFISIIEKVK